jgi:hypothetical protein
MATGDSTVTYKDIPGFPGYRVGDDGSVWSCRVSGHWRRLSPTTDKSRSEGRNYPYLNIRRGGKPATFKVHHLVLLAFVGPRPKGAECRHLDGNPLNNRIQNLRWGTATENAADRMSHGRVRTGESHGGAKLTELEVKAIRVRFQTGGVSKYRLAKEYHVTRAVIRKIINRETWKHIK